MTTGSQVITICDSAYRQANLESGVTSFSTTQEFPYSIAIDLLNTVIQDMNNIGNYWFMQTATPLTYVPSGNTYDCNALGIDPKRIIRIRRELGNFWYELTELNWRSFQKYYRMATVQMSAPLNWSKWGNTIYLDTIPDQDYQLNVYHFADIPLATITTQILPIPLANEDVIREGVYAYLLQRLALPGWQSAYENFILKAQRLIADTKKDAGLPVQAPANF